MMADLLYTIDNGIARIVLNRPKKRNALSAGLVAELKAALSESAANADVRVVLLTGAGQDFCSGADLSGLHKAIDSTVLDNMADASAMADLFLAMRYHPRPIVAAVRGRALAGGCGLATAADVILASETAQFGYPEVNIGFLPAMVMAILRRSVSEKRAFDLIAMGEILTAQTAQDIGMVTRVFSDETFDLEVDAYAGKLASKSASAVALSKQLLYHIDSMGFEAALRAGVQVNAMARTTADFQAGIKKFLNK